MISKTITVISGLESRSVALLVQIASKYQSKMTVTIGDKSVNAKSIMGVISLGILDNQEVTLTADGEDEGAAIKELENFLNESRS